MGRRAAEYLRRSEVSAPRAGLCPAAAPAVALRLALLVELRPGLTIDDALQGHGLGLELHPHLTGQRSGGVEVVVRLVLQL